MALITAAQLIKDIRSEKIESLYYFYGHDTAALESLTKKLVAKLCPSDAQTMNLHKFDGKKPDIPQLADACEALPMFAQRVVVTINDLNIDGITKSDGDDIRKILSDLSETTTVIIYATGTDLYKNKRNLTDKNKRFSEYCAKRGTACDFAYKRPADLARTIAAYFEKNGCSINRSNAEYIAQLCLCDTAFITKELEKLSAYAENREITREDIDLLCIRRIESDGFSLALNVLQGNAEMVFKRVRELEIQNYEAFEILGIISFSMTDIYRAKLAKTTGRGYNEVVNDFGYPRNREFAVKNAYNECSNISAERIRKTFEILAETDFGLKTHSRGKSGDMLSLEQGLAKSMALRC